MGSFLARVRINSLDDHSEKNRAINETKPLDLDEMDDMKKTKQK